MIQRITLTKPLLPMLYTFIDILFILCITYEYKYKKSTYLWQILLTLFHLMMFHIPLTHPNRVYGSFRADFDAIL